VIRLDKYLSNMGIGSRKDVRIYVKKGCVSVNGNIASDYGMYVNEDCDVVVCNGSTVEYKKYVYLMMNKPAGVISATEDKRGAKTVIDLIGEDYSFYELTPAGRLDIDTEGFVILTNDGTFIHNIITPERHVDKIYYCETEGGCYSDDDIKAFHDGIVLADGTKCEEASLKIILNSNDFQETNLSALEGLSDNIKKEILDRVIPEDFSKVLVTLHEGKFHQVKRMVFSINKKVIYLKRLSIGGVELDCSLPLGGYREITAEELKKLKG